MVWILVSQNFNLIMKRCGSRLSILRTPRRGLQITVTT